MKNVVVIAGPTGSGKDSIIRELQSRYSNIEFAVNAVTRAPREGEQNGVSYHFISNEEFKKEMAEGNIPEHYYREAINAYYGLYKPDLDARLATGKVVFVQVQIVGATYLKEHYGATTIFVMPSQSGEFEKRARSRSAMSDAEWEERKRHTLREIEQDSVHYDYRLKNEEGKLSETADAVVALLSKEGFVLIPREREAVKNVTRNDTVAK